MYSIFDSVKDELISFNGYQDIKNELVVNYGVSGNMPYSTFCKIASLKKEEIAAIDNTLRQILSSNEVILMYGSGYDSTTMYLNRKKEIIENASRFVGSMMRPERLLLISNHIKASDYKVAESIQFTFSFDVLNPLVEDVVQFKKRIYRTTIIDSFLNDLSC